MKGFDLKRLVTLLSLLLVAAFVSTLAIGYYSADAAVTSATITFGSSGNWQTYYDSNNPRVTNKVNGTGTAYKKGQGTTTETVNKTKFVLLDNASTNKNDPYLFLKFDGGITLSENDIIYVRYCVNQVTATGTPSNALIFFYDTSRNLVKQTADSSKNVTAGLTYRQGDVMGDAYAVIPQAGTYGYLRLDIPNNGDASGGSVHIAEIYVGPPSGSPVKYTIAWKNADGSDYTTQSYGYNQLLTLPANPTYGTQESTIDTVAEVNATSATYSFKGWRANTDSALTGGNVFTASELNYRVKEGKTYYACYTPHYRIRFYTKDGGSLLKWAYVPIGSNIGSKVSSLPTNISTIGSSGDEVMYYAWDDDANRWHCDTATGSVASDEAIKADNPTKARDFYARYETRWRVRILNKNGGVLKTEYVPNGSKLSSLPSVPQIGNTGDTLVYRHYPDQWWCDSYPSDGKTGNGASSATVLGWAVTKTRDFYARYQEYYRIRFFERTNVTSKTGYDWIQVGGTCYVKHGSELEGNFASPESKEWYDTAGTTMIGCHRVVYSDATGNAYNEPDLQEPYWLEGQNGTKPLSESTIMTQSITAAKDYYAQYKIQYAVRFYKAGGGMIAYDSYGTDDYGWLDEGDYVNADGVPGADLYGSVSGKTFVGWVSTGKTAAGNGNPTADSIGAIDPTTYKVTGPLFLHPRFLDNSFVGSSTDGLVFKRTITEVDPETYEYQVRVEVYSYGAAISGALDIYDSYLGPFALVDGKGAQIFYQAYLGNGKFDESTLSNSQTSGYQNPVTRTTNAGDYAYVYEKSTDTNVWKSVKFSGSAHTAYNTVHVRFFDANFKTYASGESGSTKSQYAKNIDAVRNGMALREYDSTNTTNNPYKTFPKGFRIVLQYNIKLNENGTMGGNNYDLSHDDYMKIVANGKTYDFHSSNYGTTCVYKDASGATKTNTKVTEPNVNIKIQYDFVVHDYYMDLLDYDNAKDGDTKNKRVMGLLSALRNDIKTNNSTVYGRMFTHGNTEIRNDEPYNPNKMYDLPNTDVDGSRNARINIRTTVTHENGQLLYATKILGNEDILQSDYEAHVDYSKLDQWADVDFTKDHKVTVSVKIEAISNETDSFGNAPEDSTWEGSAEAYFFAPRFIVADYGRAAAVDMQRESQHGVDYGYVETPSYVLRNTYGTGGSETIRLTTTSGTSIVAPVSADEGGKRTYHGGNGWLFQVRKGENANDTTAIYGFNQGQNFSQDVGKGQSILSDYKVASYTTDVINHLKYSEDTTITRNVYVIPANNILYHEHFMDFTKGRSVTNSALNWKPEGSLNTYVIYDNTDAYGYSSVVRSSVKDSANGDYGERIMVASPNSNTRNVYGNFTFTGTGFEILSRSAPDSGVLVVQVYDADGTLVKNILADTYLESMTLYQVPVVQCTDLPYGEYSVEFRAYYHEIFDHALSYKSLSFSLTEQDIRDALGLSPDDPLEYTLSASGYRNRPSTRGNGVGSYNVYVDGVRIYNPLGDLYECTETIEYTGSDGVTTNKNSSYNATAENIAYALYGLNNERNAQFINLNDMLLDSTNSNDWVYDLTGDGSVGSAPNYDHAGDIDGVLYIAYSNSTAGNDSAPTEGIFIGMDGEILVDSNNYLLKSDGKTRMLSACHNAEISRSWEKSTVIKDTYSWVYTCHCDKPHTLNRQQIHDTGITFYNATYETIGPEHEIYLQDYNGVAFCLGKNISTVQLGLRSVNGNKIAVRAYQPNGNTLTYNIIADNYSTKTEMYFDVTKSLYKDSSGNYYLFIGSGNSGWDGIVGLDNIKITTTDGSIKRPYINTTTIQLAEMAFSNANELPVDESVQMAHTLALENDITVKYIAKAEQLAQYDSFYMEVTAPVYEGNELVGEKTVRLEPVAEGETYGFYFEGVSAKQMNDTLTAQIFMVKDGVTYVSRINDYSVANYAYNMLAKAEASDALKTVCANLLRYGAEAQKYFGYRTDALVDEELTQEQKLYLYDTDSLALVSGTAVLNDCESPNVSFKSATLVLNSKVIVRYVLNLSAYEGDAEELSVRLCYLNDSGETVSVVLTALETVDEAAGLYAVEFDSLAAKQMRTLVTAAVYYGETQLSRSVQYSIESYAAKAQGEIADLCNAMIAYGDAAKAFFAK